MVRNISLISTLFILFLFSSGMASANIVIDSPNDVIYSGTFNGTNIFADLIDTSSLIVHSNITVSGTVDGRDISTDGTVLDTHVSDSSNPHVVTKEQIGLGNLTDDTQLKTSQLETTITDDDSKVASSGAIVDYVDGIIASIYAYIDSVATPAGIISPYGGSTAPTGYLLCDGSAVSRIEYAGLFAVIGTAYGEGDGNTTFNVPNMQGNVAVGIGSSGVTSLGETGGEQEHQLTIAEMPSHTHSVYYSKYDVGTGTPYALKSGGQNGNQASGSSGSNTAHNNMQPYVATNYVIKY